MLELVGDSNLEISHFLKAASVAFFVKVQKGNQNFHENHVV
jgi:hypothetical protein